MRKGLVVLLTVVMVGAFALPAVADISFFGSARVIPTYYNNFDFNKSTADKPTVNEGGWVSGEHIRSEFRLGWKAGGDNWKVMMIGETDVIYEKDTADRTFLTTADKNGWSNFGAEFGIERVELEYTFVPALFLKTGWNIRAADIRTGGLLFGDDHPFIEIGGKPIANLGYTLTYIPIQNREIIGDSTHIGADNTTNTGLTATPADSSLTNDWRAYMLKVDVNVGAGAAKATLSPVILYSDNRAKNAKIYYYGIEGMGQFGMIKPSFEVIIADGEFRGTSKDIKSAAAFAGVEVAVNKAFNPYLAFRYAKGDDNSSDSEVEGFVGITDIGRFTPLMGMDGNILGEHLSSGANIYNSPLYSYSPDRAVGGNVYGGIGNASSGNNPGQQLIAFGAKGAVNNFSYKAQAFLIRYDKTGNLVKTGGGSVSKTAGTTFDLQLGYAFSKNFSANYIYSVFAPGSGIKDQLPAGADDTYASLHSLNLVWVY